MWADQEDLTVLRALGFVCSFVLEIYFCFMSKGVWSSYMSVHHTHAWCPLRPEDCVGPFGTRGIDARELSYRCWTQTEILWRSRYLPRLSTFFFLKSISCLFVFLFPFCFETEFHVAWAGLQVSI